MSRVPAMPTRPSGRARVAEEPTVTAADVVLHPEYGGSEVSVDGDEHPIPETTDLLAVVRTAAVAA